MNREKLSPEDAIKLVHDHGGLVFAAHPVFIGVDYVAALRQLTNWGLDGVETFYKHYDDDAFSAISHAILYNILGVI